ncbi:MAG TPA: GNAT family N-acetyltransferase [Candidatus Nanopelagicales bacterium]|nr:GNAT family N-acetyltransferase [Candidatus Nanopelagicales bacterium]
MVAWDGTTILTTERLTLRTFRRDDLDPYFALNTHPDVYRWLGGSPLTRAWSDEIAEWGNECVETQGYGLVAVERTDDRAFLGMTGLHHQESFPDDVEAAWRLHPDHWGHGYAAEAARAWVDHGFAAYELPRIISTTDPDNLRSQAVMRRCGLAYERDVRVIDSGDEFDAVLWSLDRATWLSRR